MFNCRDKNCMHVKKKFESVELNNCNKRHLRNDIRAAKEKRFRKHIIYTNKNV